MAKTVLPLVYQKRRDRTAGFTPLFRFKNIGYRG